MEAFLDNPPFHRTFLITLCLTALLIAVQEGALATSIEDIKKDGLRQRTDPSQSILFPTARRGFSSRLNSEDALSTTPKRTLVTGNSLLMS